MHGFARTVILYISASILAKVTGHRQVFSECNVLQDSASMNMSRPKKGVTQADVNRFYGIPEEREAPVSSSGITQADVDRFFGGPEQDQPVGLWVTVAPRLESHHKVFHAKNSGKIPGWLHWAAPVIVPWSGEEVFLDGLIDEMLPKIQGILTKRGISVSFFFPPKEGKIMNFQGKRKGTQGVTFLIRVDDISAKAFKASNLEMVRDGIIGQMMTHQVGLQTLTEQLEAEGVPHAKVECVRSDNPGELSVQITALKRDILNIAVPKFMGLKGEHDWMAIAARKLGFKRTKSANIAKTVKDTIELTMKTQFKANGLVADINAETDQLNGKRDDNGNKVVSITVGISVLEIEPGPFFPNQKAVIRDAIVEVLGGDDEESLEYQLQAQNFPSTAYFVKCGWPGPNPPADGEIPRGFRTQVLGCADCGILSADDGANIADNPCDNSIW